MTVWLHLPQRSMIRMHCTCVRTPCSFHLQSFSSRLVSCVGRIRAAQAFSCHHGLYKLMPGNWNKYISVRSCEKSLDCRRLLIPPIIASSFLTCFPSPCQITQVHTDWQRRQNEAHISWQTLPTKKKIRACSRYTPVSASERI